jgi:hypothetical protein
LTAICGLTVLALILLKTLGGPVLPLFIAGLLHLLAIIGFLDSDPRHYLPTIMIFAMLAGGAGAALLEGKLSRPTKFGLGLAILVAVFLGHGEKPKILPEFGLLFNHGPEQISYRLLPPNKAQLWLDANSPKNARVMTTAAAFYLRRAEFFAPPDAASRLEDLGADYILIERSPSLRPLEANNDWRLAHRQFRFREANPRLTPLWQALSDPRHWQPVYEQRDWCVFRKVKPESDGSLLRPDLPGKLPGKALP